MFSKFIGLIFPNAESSFVEYILPAVAAFVLLVIWWTLLLACSKFVKIKAQKNFSADTQANLLEKFIAHHTSAILKTLSSARWVVTFYTLLILLSHILATVSLKLQSLKSEDFRESLHNYSTKASVFSNSLAHFTMNIYITILIAVWCINIIQKGFNVIIYKADKDDLVSLDGRSSAKKTTLSYVAGNLIKIVISAIALITILENLGINITALLATAGLASVAIGFGAQSLVKDFISGFFILFEDQLTVGDAVELSSSAGLFAGSVERMTLRMVCVRSNEGSLVTIPNGDIRCVKNFSTDWSRIDFKYAIDIHCDLEKAALLFKQEVDKLYADFPVDIISPPDIRPFEKMGDHENKTVAAFFRVYIKTTGTASKSRLEMELNKRLVLRFKDENILINSGIKK